MRGCSIDAVIWVLVVYDILLDGGGYGTRSKIPSRLCIDYLHTRPNLMCVYIVEKRECDV